mgnify:CR=1 FL=1
MVSGTEHAPSAHCCPPGTVGYDTRIRMFPTYALHTRMYKGDRSDRLDPENRSRVDPYDRSRWHRSGGKGPPVWGRGLFPFPNLYTPLILWPHVLDLHPNGLHHHDREIWADDPVGTPRYLLKAYHDRGVPTHTYHHPECDQICHIS